MKIRLTDIPQEGLTINDNLSLENINTRMNEAPDNDIVFTEAPSVSLAVTKDKGGAQASGIASSKYEQICPKCTEKVEYTVKIDLNLILKPKVIDPKKSNEDWDDDIGIIYFDGEHIDVEDVIQETLILELSPYGKPHDGCKNILVDTPEVDKKESKTSLGKLLKDAGIH